MKFPQNDAADFVARFQRALRVHLPLMRMGIESNVHATAPLLELIMKKYLLKTSEGLAGRILEATEETIGNLHESPG